MRRITIQKALVTIGILAVAAGFCVCLPFPVLRQANGTSPGVAFSQDLLREQNGQQGGAGPTGIRLSELVTPADGVVSRPIASVSLTEEQKKELGASTGSSLVPALSAPSSLAGKTKNEALPAATTPFPAVSGLANTPMNVKTNTPSAEGAGMVAPLSSAPNALATSSDKTSSQSGVTGKEPSNFPSLPGNNASVLLPGKTDTPAVVSGSKSQTVTEAGSQRIPSAGRVPATPPLSVHPGTSSGNFKSDPGMNLPGTSNDMLKSGNKLPAPSTSVKVGADGPDFVRPTKTNFPGLVPGTGLDSSQSKAKGLAGSVPSTSVAAGKETSPQSPRGMSGQGHPGPAQMEGAQDVSVVLEKIAPQEVQVNREEIFRVIVKNTGKGTAKNIVLRDQVPARSVLVSTTPKSEPAADGVLLWKPFDLGPGEHKEFKYVLVPQEEGELGSVASVTFSAEASARTRSTKPVLRLDVKAPQDIVVGGEFTLEIAISNTGSGTANGVVLLETIPDELFHPGGKVLDNQIKTIAPQETKQLTLTLKGLKPGKAINRLSVTADNGLVEECQTSIMVTSPELQLEIAGAKTRYLDREATFILKIRNPGTAVAKDVRLVAELPQNVEFVRTNNLGEYNKAKHTVCWELVELPQNLPPGQLELVVKPVQPGNGRIVLRGTGQNDLATEVSQDITIDGLPALAYEVRSLTDPVEVGKEALYEVRISNRGTKASTNINMSILIPAEMKIISSEGPTAYRENDKGVTFARLNSLDPKQEAVYRISATCSKPGDHRIKVQVSSDDMELLVKEESTRVYY